VLREEYRLKVFENRVLRIIFGPNRDELLRGRIKFHDEECHSLYSSPNITRMIKSRTMRWAVHVAHMKKMRNVYKILVGKPGWKRPLGRPRCRWEDIKIDLREAGFGNVDWIHLAQDRDQ
jgi:hypothetical protein